MRGDKIPSPLFDLLDHLSESVRPSRSVGALGTDSVAHALTDPSDTAKHGDDTSRRDRSDELLCQVIAVLLVCRSDFSSPGFLPPSDHEPASSLVKVHRTDVWPTSEAPDARDAAQTSPAMAPVPVHRVAEVVDETRLDLGDEGVELEEGRGPVDLEGGGEVERPVREVQVAGVDPAETEVQSCGCEGWCREFDVGGCWSEGRWVQEDLREVGRSGHQYEPVSSEDDGAGERVVRVCGRVGAIPIALGSLQVYPHVAVELARPHVRQIVTELVSSLGEVASPT